jgi:hypothetical protein
MNSPSALIWVKAVRHAACVTFGRKPLENDMAKAASEHDRRIRLRAARMWREAGSPMGREDEYLERARELQAFVDHPNAALLPNPMLEHPHPGGSEQPVEEAELLENLGEFPGRTDQGERMPAPMTKKRARAFLRRS